MAQIDGFINKKKLCSSCIKGGGGHFSRIYINVTFFLLMMFQTLTGHYSSDDSNKILLYFFLNG